jgi:esterase/lipase superfamily enzyme
LVFFALIELFRHKPAASQSRNNRFCLGLLILVLAGCGHPTGVLAPVTPTAPDATIVKLLAITTRAPSNDPGTLYSGRRSRGFSLDEIDVSIPPESKRKPGEVAWPKRLPPDPRIDFATVGVRHLDSTKEAGSQWVDKHLPNSRDVLVFVHGFNNTYEDAVYRFAQIFHDSKIDAAPILFTWPSGARLFDYNYDRESTIYSRDGLETALHLLAKNRNVHEITVLAHSMGTWLAMESLRQMAIRDGRIAPKIKNVILASPDIDVDVFARQFRDLGDRRPRFTVFVSQDDRALAVSRFVAGNVNRLGQIDPNKEPYRTAVLKSGIAFIDLTQLDTGDSLHHAKFAESPQIVQAIGTRLAAGQRLTNAQIGLGDGITILAAGTAKAVGTGVGLAVSTPLAAVDPDTRRNLSGQVNNLNRQVNATSTEIDPNGIGKQLLLSPDAHTQKVE